MPTNDEAAQGSLAFVQSVFAAGGFGRGIGATMGFRGQSAAEGFVTMVGTPTRDHYNPLGSVHGGYAATILDAAMALALQTVLPLGTPYATTDLKVTYAQALTEEHGEVTAEGRVVHVGRGLAIAEGRLLTGGAELYAHATATFRIGRPKANRETAGADT